MSTVPETEMTIDFNVTEVDYEASKTRLEYALGVFVEEFRINSFRNLDRVEAILDNLGDKEADKALINSVLAILSNIEGQGRSFDFELISELGEMTCDFLRRVETGSEKMVLLLRKVVQAMRLVIQQDVRGEGGLTERALVACLRDAFSEAV